MHNKIRLHLYPLAFCLFALITWVNAQTVNRIALINLESQLITVSPDGSDLRVLTREGSFQFPAWSPQGSTVAVIGSGTNGGSVNTVADEVGASLQVHYESVSEVPFYLYWSPDSQTISFLANNPDAGIGLHLSDKDALDSRLLTTGSPFYWQWTSDSQKMLIHTGFSGAGSRLGFIDISEDSLKSNLASPGFFQAPGISASGRYIAFSSADALDGGRVFLQNNPRMSGVDAVTREIPHRGLTALSWSPVDDLLVFTNPASNTRNFFGPLKLLDATSGDLETLTDDVAVAFFWSPNGRYVAYLSAFQGSGDVAFLLDGELLARAELIQQSQLLFNLSVIDIETKEVSLLTSFAPNRLFLGQFLPFFDQYALSHRIWSPANDAIVLPMIADDNVPRIFVVPVDGSAPRAIAEGVLAFWSHQ